MVSECFRSTESSLPIGMMTKQILAHSSPRQADENHSLVTNSRLPRPR